MTLVKYKHKIWRVLCPEDLEFPPYCIRNVLIERNGKKVITNFKELTPVESKFTSMEDYL